MNKFIVGGLVLLILIIFFTLIITSFGNNNQGSRANITPIPTQFVSNSRSSGSSQNNLGGQTGSLSKSRRTITDFSTLKTFSPTQVTDTNDLQKKLPYSSADFDIKYSEGTGQYFVQLKTPGALDSLNKYLEENKLTNLRKEFPDLFVISRDSVDQQLLQEEEELIKARTSQAATAPPITPPAGKTSQQKDLALATRLQEVVKKLGEKQQPSAPSGKGSTGGGSIANPNELDKIFNEAGSKVGTPPKMLKAIMSIECGRLLSTSDAEILAWSAPGAGLPSGHGCRQNQGGYGAYGPMQFVPGTFARYGSAVNRIGGYTHTPNIQNIKDSVYAAAELFLLNSNGGSGSNWTLEQMKRAYVCYAAGCRQYDSGQLGADTERLFATFLERYNSY